MTSQINESISGDDSDQQTQTQARPGQSGGSSGPELGVKQESNSNDSSSGGSSLAGS